MTHTRQTLAFLLLLALLGAACTPMRGRGNNNGGGDDDDAAGDDDDAVGDDDDAVGDDDDAASGTEYTGTASGYLKSPVVSGDCEGDVRIYVDDDGYVTSGLLSCGSGCDITFSGPYAWSEDSFSPEFDCAIDGYVPEIYEVDAWIWGSENSYVEGNISGYGEGDYFYVSFSGFLPE